MTAKIGIRIEVAKLAEARPDFMLLPGWPLGLQPDLTAR